MFPFRWLASTRMVLAATSVTVLVSACGPTRYAYFLPQRSHVAPVLHDTGELTASLDTLPAAASTPLISERLANAPSAPIRSEVFTPKTRARTVPTSPLHRNPDSQSAQRVNRLLGSPSLAHFAPKRLPEVDRNSRTRKTHRLGVIALALAALPYGLLFIPGGSSLVWILGMTLPLTSVLMGVASITTIGRNQERLRGKGWGMAAVMLGTGFLGIALFAAAALSVSKTVRKNS